MDPTLHTVVQAEFSSFLHKTAHVWKPVCVIFFFLLYPNSRPSRPIHSVTKTKPIQSSQTCKRKRVQSKARQKVKRAFSEFIHILPYSCTSTAARRSGGSFGYFAHDPAILFSEFVDIVLVKYTILFYKSNAVVKLPLYPLHLILDLTALYAGQGASR